MSYILDALKKSENERKIAEVPTPLSPSTMYPGEHRKSRTSRNILVFIILLFLVCLGAVSTYYYFMNDDFLVTAKVKEKTEISLEPIIKAEADTQQLKSDIETLPEEYQKNTVPVVNSAPTVYEPSPLLPEGGQLKSTIEPPEVDTSIPSFDDLPPNFQQAIPDVKFTGHIYSENPAKRMIIVNNNMLREGEIIEQNFYLQEITWRGVILNFHGTVFQLFL